MQTVTKYLKTTTYILISFLIFISCNLEKEHKETIKDTYFYPTLNHFEEKSNKVFIKLDSISSFKELLERIEKIACENNIPVVTYENENSIFNLIPLHKCPNNMMISCWRERNEITITHNSINISYFDRIGIDSLPYIVKKHIQNKGKEYVFSSSPRLAFFSIQKDSLLTINKTKEILLSISESFNKINEENGDSLPLNIKIGAEKIIEIKPPPPPIETKSEN